MAASDNKNIHAGHRERLRKKVRRFGFETFYPHEVVEFILTAVIPRKNVNPTAHELINKFGSLHAVLEAPEEELIKVNGVGPKSAKVFKFLQDVSEYYLDVMREEPIPMDTPRRARAIMYDYLGKHDPGVIWQFNLDINDCLDKADPICQYDEHLTDHVQEICTSIIRSATKSVLFGCRVDHLDRHFRESIYDLVDLKEYLATVGIHVLDYYLLVGDEVYDARGVMHRIQTYRGHVDDVVSLFPKETDEMPDW